MDMITHKWKLRKILLKLARGETKPFQELFAKVVFIFVCFWCAE